MGIGTILPAKFAIRSMRRRLRLTWHRFNTLADLFLAPVGCRPACVVSSALVFCILGSAAIGSLAQTPDGAIAGRVLSASGEPVPGAVAAARELDSGVVIEARTTQDGRFLLVRLPAGLYELRLRQGSRAVSISDRIAVHLGETTEVEARWDATSSGSGNTLNISGISGEDMELLPTESGRSAVLGSDGSAYHGVAAAQSSSGLDGAVADDSFYGGIRAGAEVDPDAAADEQLDGSAGAGVGSRAISDSGRRGAPAGIFSEAAVREFRTQGQTDAAAFGSALYRHGAGGVLSTASRSGTTSLHGMFFYIARDSAWAAGDPFAIASTYSNGVVNSSMVKPADVRQQYGGRMGGPFLERKAGGGPVPRLLYFYAFDQQQRSFPAISSPGYPSFFSLTPVQQALLANRGVTADRTRSALAYLGNLTGKLPRRSRETMNFGRLDWDRRKASRIVGEYNRARWSSLAGMRSGAVVNRGIASLGSNYGQVDDAVVRWVQFLSPALSNELRLQFGRQLLYQDSQTPLAQEPKVGPGGLPPEISIGPDGFVFGTPAALGRRAFPDERRLEAADVIGWVRHGHFLQIGGDVSFLHDYTSSLNNAEGTFTYDSGSTNGHAGGLVDWITDYSFGVDAYPNGACPSIYASIHRFCFRSFSQSFGAQSLSFDTQEWAGFIQDDWRVSQRLTIHAGARYEYEFLPLPQNPNPAIDAIFGSRGATSVFPEDRNNIGPRLGLEWSPFGPGRGLIRIGYGVYYGRLPGATVRALLLNTATTASTKHVRILPTTEVACPQNSSVGFGYPCSFLTEPTGVVATTTSAMVFDRRFRLPMVQQGTISVEHPVGWGILGRAAYVLNLDRQLPNSVDLNIAPASGLRLFQLQGGIARPGVRDGETFAVPAYTSRVAPAFGPLTDLISNANATYNGFTLEARRGLGGRRGMGGIGTGLEVRVAWTWSKAIDFGQSFGATPRTSGQFDPFEVRYDKGISALNHPQRVVGTLIWSPRPRQGALPVEVSRLMDTVTSGWSFAGIFNGGSGSAYSYSIFGGTRLVGGHESINGSGGSRVLPTLGRNTLRLPAELNLDLRLTRSFRLGERASLRGAVDAFNAMNHVNISGVQQRAFLVGTAVNGVTPLIYQDAAAIAAEGLNVRPFGTYTEAGSDAAQQRQVQISFRVEF